MHIVRLKNSAAVRLRAARDADSARLLRLFYRLSDDTRYWYFGVGAPATPDWAARLVALGQPAPCAFALVAETEGEIVGVARYVAGAAGHYAEIGMVLADAWQAQGLGTRMLCGLHAVARRQAIAGFSAHVMGENRRALRMVRRVFAQAQITWTQGDFEVVMDFTR
jgi:RimJ/RimL family protein N-acetyltransferase